MVAIGTNNNSIVGGSDPKNSRAAVGDDSEVHHVSSGLRSQTVAADNPGDTTCNRTQLAPAASLHPESPTSTSSDLIADLLDEPWGYVPLHARRTEGHTLL